MRFVDIARAAALISAAGLLSACPKRDSDAAPEPTNPGAVQAPVSDKAGAEPPAAVVPAAPPVKKKDDEKGGW